MTHVVDHPIPLAKLIDETVLETSQRIERLHRLADFSGRIRPYSTEAVTIAVACLGVATTLRFMGSWTNSDFLFATYFPAIVAAGLLAGIPAAVGVTIASALIVRLYFVPLYFHFASHTYGELFDFLMYLFSAALTIAFAHYCRVVLKQLHDRNLANEILTRELQHRNKNLCSVVDVIVRKSLADEPERANKVCGRIKSVFHASELLTESQSQLLSLKGLFLQEFAPYGEGRIEVFGPDVRLSADSARHLILIVHELVTNAAKYGSLSLLSGRVLVTWQQHESAITLEWKERGGPKVSVPQHRGFGSQLIASCVKALSGTMHQNFSPDGLGCSFRFRVSRSRTAT
jgi:two-component sensor histidine kinase